MCFVSCSHEQEKSNLVGKKKLYLFDTFLFLEQLMTSFNGNPNQSRTGTQKFGPRILSNSSRGGNPGSSIHAIISMPKKSFRLKIPVWTFVVHGYSIEIWISICVS